MLLLLHADAVTALPAAALRRYELLLLLLPADAVTALLAAALRRCSLDPCGWQLLLVLRCHAATAPVLHRSHVWLQ